MQDDGPSLARADASFQSFRKLNVCGVTRAPRPLVSEVYAFSRKFSWRILSEHSALRICPIKDLTLL